MTMARKSRFSWLGISLAAVYVLIVVAVYVLTAASPPDDGLEWLPFVYLSMPWYAVGSWLLFPGFILNAGLLFLLGTLIQKLWRRMRKREA